MSEVLLNKDSFQEE